MTTFMILLCIASFIVGAIWGRPLLGRFFDDLSKLFGSNSR
jgi:hypothetical protein